MKAKKHRLHDVRLPKKQASKKYFEIKLPKKTASKKYAIKLPNGKTVF